MKSFFFPISPTTISHREYTDLLGKRTGTNLFVFYDNRVDLNCFFSVKDCGIWNRIAVNKGLYVEPRTKHGFLDTIDQFYEKIHDPNLKGAVFFAVCRGKVSVFLLLFSSMLIFDKIVKISFYNFLGQWRFGFF